MVRRLEIDVRRGAGRPALLASLVIVSLLVTTLWFREGSSGPLHALRRGLLAITLPFNEVGTAVTTPFRAVADWATGGSVNRAQFDALKAQNLELKKRLFQFEESSRETSRVAALVAFAQLQDYPTVGARVIGLPTDSWGGSITIDRGTDKGVKPGAPVVAAGGLVGQVIEATAWNAKVRLITDVNSGVAVMIQRTRADAIVNGSLDGTLRLSFLDKAKTPRRGDVLFTSGIGGVYPKGIVVGEVTDVLSRPADLFPDVQVASRVEIGRIEEVLVLTGSPTLTQPGAGE